MRGRPPPAMAPLAGTLAPVLLLLLLTISNASGDSSAAAGDRAALLRFKSSISSDTGGLLRGWSGAGNHCSWPGVTCDADARVISLNISAKVATFPPAATFRRLVAPDNGSRLFGELSPAVASLRRLRILSLPFHSLSGELPGEIWRLPYLEFVDLEGNGGLLGSLPPLLPPRLRFLSLAGNRFHGELPASLANSTILQTLDLSFNQLNGSVPGSLFALPELRELSLASNRLGGAIPAAAGCRSLAFLDLSGNLLVGSIPRSLANCSQLQAILLFSNLLDDVIPPELGQLGKLRALDISRNSLSGSVPPELGGCVELSVLVLSNPYAPLISSNALDYADVDDFNYFQGGIPEVVVTLPKLRVLWAPRATLEGELPGNWSACESLEMVNLGENLFSGGFPMGLASCKNLNFLNLSSNKLIGWIDAGFPVPCMDVFDVSGNKLSGSLPAFTSKSCASSQLLSDDLASAYSSFFTYQALAEFASSTFALGTGIGSYHSFGQNNFTGTLPSLLLAAEKSGVQATYAFLADGNSLSGQLEPSMFDRCNDSKGFIVDLSNNLISGGIPMEIGSMCASLVVLDVAGNQITGSIPRSIGQSDNLVNLDLSRNQLRGEIPDSVCNLQHLERVSLGHNFLNGSIPAGIDKLHSLKVLDLSSNFLTGKIPNALTDLTNLTALLLDNNNLTGSIPSGFADAASLATFNVSFNNLSGPVPANSNTVRCDSVIGNPLLQSCHIYSLAVPSAGQQGRGLNSPDYNNSAPADSQSQGGNSEFSSIEIASITSAAAIVAVLLALIVLFIYTRKCAPRFSVQSAGSREVTTFTDIGVPITFESVVRATGSFNASNCIGSGGFGATYKAEIAPGVLVAIKRLSVGRFQGVQQFHAEIKTLGRLRHPNLVTLIGYHLSESEMFLIYNYLPGGNLERFIQERSKRPVDWRMLHKIALDIARALAYLHDSCVPRILHRDVKPSNILLDNDYNAYLSDFGLARLLGNSETHATTGVAGTFGYVAPEYAMTCRVSDKADVYSYGVVLMELISDKKALDPSFSPYGNGFNIVAWACMLLRQGRAREFFIGGLWDASPHDDLVETLHLAVMCTVDSLSIRPTMKQVVQRLKQLQPPIREHR